MLPMREIHDIRYNDFAVENHLQECRACIEYTAIVMANEAYGVGILLFVVETTDGIAFRLFENCLRKCNMLEQRIIRLCEENFNVGCMIVCRSQAGIDFVNDHRLDKR